MATENLPISGLYPLTGSLTPNDLLVISQQKPEGWKSFHVDISKFVDLVIEGMNDGSVFMRKVYNAENSGLTGSGLLTDALSLDWSYLRTQFAPAGVGAAYVATTTRVIAGNGLTGGGDLTANRTLTLGTPGTITASTTNSVAAESHTHAIEKASTAVAGVVKLIDTLTSTSTADAATARTVKALNDAKAEKSISITAGNGLTGGGDLSAGRTVTLGTPGGLTESTTNAVTADSHTHAIAKASTAAAGIVKLNDTLTSTSAAEAATARQAKALNDAKADKTVTINTGWGIKGGGNLSANRTIELNLAELDTRYTASGAVNAYVPLTRSISAGTGLSGGGDLSANRSFSVNYGTAAGTAAQGNDSRINNGQTAFGWGNHSAAGYLKTVALRASSGLLGTGVNAANGLGIDYNALNTRYLPLTGGTVNGNLTITGKLTAPGLDTGIPTGFIAWFNCARSSLPDGWIPADGQVVERTAFPDLWAMVNGKKVQVVTDALWLANVDETLTTNNLTNNRGCYTTGPAGQTANFRVPDLNGITSGSISGPVLRGDGYLTATKAKASKAAGVVENDMMRNIQGSLGYGENNESAPERFATGPFYKTSPANQVGSNKTDWDNHGFAFDADRVVPTGAEFAMKSVRGVFAIKARGGTTPAAAGAAPATTTANTFNGAQRIVGNLEVTGVLTYGSMAGFEGLLQPNGYQKLPGGFILQWGYSHLDSHGGEGNLSITFPVAFPTQCLWAISNRGTASASGDNTDGGVTVHSFTKTALSVHLATYYGGATGSLRGVYWMAIGK